MKKNLFIKLLFLLLLILPLKNAFSVEGFVYVITLQGVINPVASEYIERGVTLANTQGASALV
ncbi:MAG: hypothetical protein D6710_11325, partial [Nitrospirae bacterium]